MWWSFVARRLVSAVPTLLGVLTVVFLFVRLVPGDPAQAILGEYATPAPVIGNQPSCTEKTMMSSMPNQKFGMLIPRSAAVVTP